MSSSWWHGCPLVATGNGGARRSVPERPDPGSAQRETQHARPRWPAHSRRLIRRNTRYTQGKREFQRAPARSAAEFLNLVSQVRILPGAYNKQPENGLCLFVGVHRATGSATRGANSATNSFVAGVDRRSPADVDIRSIDCAVARSTDLTSVSINGNGATDGSVIRIDLGG